MARGSGVGSGAFDHVVFLSSGVQGGTASGQPCCCSGQSSDGASSSFGIRISSRSGRRDTNNWCSDMDSRVHSPMLEQKGFGVSYLDPDGFSPPLHHHDRHQRPSLVMVLPRQSKSDPFNSQGEGSKEGWRRRLSCTGSLPSAGPSCRRQSRWCLDPSSPSVSNYS